MQDTASDVIQQMRVFLMGARVSRINCRKSALLVISWQVVAVATNVFLFSFEVFGQCKVAFSCVFNRAEEEMTILE